MNIFKIKKEREDVLELMHPSLPPEIKTTKLVSK